MVQKHVTVFINDLTGKELAEGTGETVNFSLDGVHYELDTDAKAAQKLRSILDRYVRAGRQVHSGRRPRHVPTPVDNAAVRAWAASHGINVSARGRLAASVVAQFQAAGN